MARFAALAELVRVRNSFAVSSRGLRFFPVMKGHEDGGNVL
jgi:hypothetical protein